MNNDLFTLLTRLIKEIKMAVKKADVVMNIKHLLEDLKDEMVAYSSLPMADLKQLQNALLDARETIQDRYYKKNGTRAESRCVLSHSIVKMKQQLLVLIAILLFETVININCSITC